jgi:hypothetical protein
MPNQPHAQARGEPQQLRPRELPANHDLASRVDPNEVKDCLPQIDADDVDFHGPPPVPLLIARSLEAAEHTN